MGARRKVDGVDDDESAAVTAMDAGDALLENILHRGGDDGAKRRLGDGGNVAASVPKLTILRLRLLEASERASFASCLSLTTAPRMSLRLSTTASSA